MKKSTAVTYYIAANGQPEIELTDTQANALDAVPMHLDEHSFHILQAQKSYKAQVLEVDFDAKSFRIRVNGNVHEIKISDQYDKLVKDMGLTVGTVGKISNIKAPMPGLVLEVCVGVGQAVTKGDMLLILEAMKMENVLKATSDGIVKAVHIQKGTPVEKGQLLLEME